MSVSTRPIALNSLDSPIALQKEASGRQGAIRSRFMMVERWLPEAGKKCSKEYACA